MARFRYTGRYLRDVEREQRQLVFCLMLGSLLGALCAGLPGEAFSLTLQAQPQPPNWFRTFFHIALFPLLLSAALLLGRGPLIRLLFVLKGAAIAFSFCSICAQSAFRWLPFFLDAALVLPFWIPLGALWCRRAADPKSCLLLLPPALLLAALIACIQVLLFIL